MDSSVSQKDQFWFLRVCRHVSRWLYTFSFRASLILLGILLFTARIVLFVVSKNVSIKCVPTGVINSKLILRSRWRPYEEIPWSNNEASSVGRGSKSAVRRPPAVRETHSCRRVSPFSHFSSLISLASTVGVFTAIWNLGTFLKSGKNNPNLVNRLTPNDPYMGRTAPLTSKPCISYIYSTNIGTEYFKHALNSPFFSLQDAVCFIMLICLVPVLCTFYIQGVLKLKKNNSGAKGLKSGKKYRLLYINNVVKNIMWHDDITKKKSPFCIYMTTLDTFILWKAKCRLGIKKTGSVRMTYPWGEFLKPFLQWESNNYYLCWVCVCCLRYPAFKAQAPYWHLWPARFNNFLHVI